MALEVTTSVVADAQADAAAAAPRDFALDAEGDLSLDETGDWSMSTGAAGIASDLQARLSMLAGDYFKDLSLGVPRDRVLGVKFSKGSLEELFRGVITSTPGVGTIESLVASFDSQVRAASVAFRVRTDFGALITGAVRGVV